ncbi:hypothetical protein CR203_17790 [Salipaludibacillus neizhouensis]|uniref:ATP-grasp domain-containing protein n=1 Tax=Salipaludibacillus neizhouensis TaxID=885475 RepID=A0A3A9KEJ1_9BACI|nr:hypothetical protein [Salipaludibacillus neizhouensis]RKL65925.1 hypothetical protein CR203_17790 [Salipaludibacillus neizhouensis]
MTLKIGWVVYRKKDIIRNDRFIGFVKDAAQSFGMTLVVVPYEEIQVNVSSVDNIFTRNGEKTPDFIINRSVSPWLNEVAEVKNIPCFNSAYVARIANDKRLAHAVISSLGIPMLTSKTIHSSALFYHHNHLPTPFILKDPQGRGGTGVKYIESLEKGKLMSSMLSEELLYQPVGGKKGQDLRVYLVGNEIVAAVLRESATDFRANISIGGSSRLYTLTEEETKIVNRISDSMHMDFVGIDFLIDHNGRLLFNEMEDAVGCRSLYMNSSINIASIFMEYVAESIS